MKKIILLILLSLLSSAAFSVILDPQMHLQPLCFQDIKTCQMASQILSLPPFGNFRISSKCRPKNPFEIQNKVCQNFQGLLELTAFIDLQVIGQYQWRNQCYSNINQCLFGVQTWKGLFHPLIDFYAECGPFNRRMWKMPDQDMKGKGLYICSGTDYIELRVRAMRNR